MKKERNTERECEIIREFFNAKLPPKTSAALRKFWDSTSGRLFIESPDSRFSLRPQLSQKMEKHGLIKCMRSGSTHFAILTDKGSEYVFDLFGDL